MRWFYINGTASLCRRRILFVPRLGCSELKPDEGTLLATLTGEVSFAHATKLLGRVAGTRKALLLVFSMFWIQRAEVICFLTWAGHRMNRRWIGPGE